MKLKRIRDFAFIATIAILVSTGSLVNAQAQTDVLVEFKDVREGDWRTARAIAEGFAGRSSRTTYESLRRDWAGIDKSVVRKELINAFLKTVHPDGLRIALLGLEDKDAEVRKETVQQLAFTLGLPYTLTPEQIKAQILPRQKQDLEQVRKNRAREVVVALRSAEANAVPSLLEATRPLWYSKQVRQTALEAGLLNALRARFVSNTAIPMVQKAVIETLYDFDVSEPFLKEIFAATEAGSNIDAEVQAAGLHYLAKKRYRPAYERLKEKLKRDVSSGVSGNDLFHTAEGLAVFGEPELIPLFIGAIAADNNDSKYWVGYFGLTPLTGVAYDSIHDSEWWKLWWQLHKSELPESVQAMPIPEFPHSPKYQEPLPQSVHANRQQSLAALITQYQVALHQGGYVGGESLASLGGAAEIPTMIGLIASDNTYNSIYGIGYFGLSRLTGVAYSPLHDGNWWELWYEAHKNELPESVRTIPIPVFPRSKKFLSPISKELHSSPDKLRDKLIADLRETVEDSGEKASTNQFEAAQRVSALKDPRTVPAIIEMLPEANEKTKPILYSLDHYGLNQLTGIPYQEKRGRTWWVQWWQENKTEFEKRYTDRKPDFQTLTYHPATQQLEKLIFAADCKYDPKVSPVTSEEKADENPEDIADTPSVRRFAGGDKNKLYRLVGFDPKAPASGEGYSLLLILPGGDGSEEFRWFIRRIKKNSLPKNMLVAQLVAPQWGEWQAKNLVWPTRKTPFHGMKFSTEEFIEATIVDVQRQTKIDPKRVYTMAWSSSGPAVYTHLGTKGSSVAGAFIAMSVFRPNEIPDPSSLAGKRVYLYHSPQDFIKIQQARDGETFLKTHGAAVQFREYQGGHGWHENIYDAVQQAVRYIQSSTP